jgi:threonine/homoserine/homoserine lactone efflux protein
MEALFTGQVLLAYSIYFLGVASPGPSNLAIMGTAMASGRKPALILSLGIIVGSCFWGVLAAFGLSTVLHHYSSFLFLMKLLAGMYLLWLAFRAARSALPLWLKKNGSQKSSGNAITKNVGDNFPDDVMNSQVAQDTKKIFLRNL